MTSNYPHGWENGVVINGVPYDKPHSGEVFWVNNSGVLATKGIGAANANKGSYLQPFLTIDYAVGRCTANRGDVIYVMPGHSETVSGAAGIDFDVAGITVIGLGTGDKQPRIDFTATTSTVEVNADNITLQNLNFHANISGVVVGLSVLTLATDLLVSECVFDVETTTTDEFVIAINVGVGCSRLVVENCIMDMGLGGAAAAIKFVGATAGATIKNNRIVGDYSLALISGITTLSTEIYVHDNFLMNGGAGNIGTVACMVLLTGTTGAFWNNKFVTNVTAAVTAAVAADTMVNAGENFISTSVEAQGQQIDGGTNGLVRSATCITKADETDGLGLFTVVGTINVWGIKQLATTAADSAVLLGVQLDATDATLDATWVTDTNVSTETSVGDFAVAASAGGAFTIRQVETPTTGDQLWNTPIVCPAGQIEQATSGTPGALVSSYTIYWSEVTAGATCVAVA